METDHPPWGGSFLSKNMYLGISENGEFIGIYGKFNDQCGKTYD